ncbi:hypothetical protein IOD13_18830 [Brevibacterium casei]|nr:hypothetical protein [Brevibacterium casei]
MASSSAVLTGDEHADPRQTIAAPSGTATSSPFSSGTPVESVSTVTAGCFDARVRRASSRLATRTGASARSACQSACPHPRGARWASAR